MSVVKRQNPQPDEHIIADDSIGQNKLKRKSTTRIDDSQIGNPTRQSVLLLTKPSYALGLGSKTLRSENRARLNHLLRQLLRQQNWTEASGVLSVLLKGTGKDKSLPNNRFKYTALMEVLTHLRADYFNTTKIKNIYDIWMRKIGMPKGQAIEDKFVVHLEFILFCLAEGNVEDGHQAALSLIQENEFGRDPVSCMVLGLTFYQLWYSKVPKEMLLTDSEQVAAPRQTNDNTNSQEAVTVHPCNSDSSIKNEQISFMESDSRLQRENSIRVDDSIKIGNPLQFFQPQGFYANSTDDTGNEVSFYHGDQFQHPSNFSALEGLNSLLLPVRLPQSIEHSEDLLSSHRQMFNDYYKEAVKYLRLALCSTPLILAALLPLIQLLLVGGQVDEVLNILLQFCCNSNPTLIRLRASLLQHFDHKNSAELASCYENILKKDPTCCNSLAQLITMHQNGEYSTESLVEMIALHLDAAYADYNAWREFASCFLKLLEHEEDRMSWCQDGNETGLEKRSSVSFNEIPKIFKEGKSGKNWRLRCKWWLTRHFSCSTHASEIAAGDLQLATYKAASACHIYGPQFAYVVDVCNRLQEKNERDLFLFLQLNIGKSMRLASSFSQK